MKKKLKLVKLVLVRENVKPLDAKQLAVVVGAASTFSANGIQSHAQ